MSKIWFIDEIIIPYLQTNHTFCLKLDVVIFWRLNINSYDCLQYEIGNAWYRKLFIRVEFLLNMVSNFWQKWNFDKSGISAKAEFQQKWNFDTSGISTQVEFRKSGISTKVEFRQKWNFDKNGISTKNRRPLKK